MKRQMVAITVEVRDHQVVLSQEGGSGGNHREIVLPVEQIGYLADLLLRLDRTRDSADAASPKKRATDSADAGRGVVEPTEDVAAVS